MIAPTVDTVEIDSSAPVAPYVNLTQHNAFPGAGPLKMTRPALSEEECAYRLLRICGAATVIYLLVVVARLLTLHVVPAQDGASYLYQAQHLDYYLRVDATTNGIAYHGPGFPVLVRAFMLVFHNPLTAAKMAVGLIVVGYLVVTWLLLHLWFTPRVARVAYLLGLCMLPLLETLTSIGSDAGGALCALAGLLILQAKTQDKEQNLFLPASLLLAGAAGMLFGGAYLFRYMYKLLPLVVIATWMLFDPAHIREKTGCCVALAFGFGIVFVGWAICCKMGRGEWFPDRNHAAMVWQALDHSNSWIHFSDYASRYPTILDVFRHQGPAVIHAWGKTLYHAPTDFVFSTFTLSGLLLPAGLFLYLRQLNFVRLQFLMFALSLIGVTAFFWLETRTLLPLMFWLWGLCSLAAQSEFIPQRLDDLYEDGSWLWRGLARAYLRPFVLAAMFASLLIPMLRAQPWRSRPAPLEVECMRAGQALHAIAKRHETLAASVYSIGQVGDVHTICLHQILPHDSRFADNLLLRILATHTNYLAYVEGQSRYEYPGLEFLLTPKDPRVPANFELVYQNDVSPHVVIYRVHWWVWAQNRQRERSQESRRSGGGERPLAQMGRTLFDAQTHRGKGADLQ